MERGLAAAAGCVVEPRGGHRPKVGPPRGGEQVIFRGVGRYAESR